MKFSTLTIEFSQGSTDGMYLPRYTLAAPDSEAPELFGYGAEIPLPAPVPALESEVAVFEHTRDLSGKVFGTTTGSLALEKATTFAEALGVTLRVRVSAGADAPKVLDQHWELLANPRNDYRPLAWGQRTCLSRFMPSVADRTPPRPPIGRLRAIGLIASPTNVTGLNPVDLAREMAVIDESLANSRIKRLYGSRANLEPLLDELRAGCDVLYLACHGRLKTGVPYLYFEDSRHEARPVDASVLADKIAEMKTPPPRLVVLASCESAGNAVSAARDDGGFFLSAAAKLIKAGAAAVVGMQGRVVQDASRTFVRAFFRELLAHGQVEAAAAAARMEMPQNSDWWLPALLVAVDSGVLWAGGAPREFANWDEVLKAVARGTATPILGSDVVEQLSKRRTAAYFATQLRHRTPSGSTLELQEVAQQLKVENDKDWPPTVLENFYLRVESDEGIDRPDLPLAASVSEWGKAALSPPAFNPYSELASWRVPLYITTNPDDFLKDALETQNRPAKVIICPWKDDTPGIRDDIPFTLQLSLDTPVVYHLFGHLTDKNAIVLTEDDFFDHLIWVSQHSARTIPSSIPTRLANSSLLFLGFHLDDWEFRVVLRNIGKMQSVEMLAGKLHVAVQLDPTELTSEQQTDAHRALEDYFRNTEVKLSIYWGTVEDFLTEMRRERQKRERNLRGREGEGQASLGQNATEDAKNREDTRIVSGPGL